MVKPLICAMHRDGTKFANVNMKIHFKMTSPLVFVLAQKDVKLVEDMESTSTSTLILKRIDDIKALV